MEYNKKDASAETENHLTLCCFSMSVGKYKKNGKFRKERQKILLKCLLPEDLYELPTS